MSTDGRRALRALHQTESARQHHDAAALQHAETRLVSLCNTLRDLQRHRDVLSRALSLLGDVSPNKPQPLDRAWSWRARLARGRMALAAAERARADAEARVVEATRLRDALRQSVTVATARRLACEARLGALAEGPGDPGDDA